jgi:transcription elongation factor Elf1
MNEPEWLRTQLTSFTCPACGRSYGASRIRLLAERDGLYFVDLDCRACGSHTVAIVTVELEDSEASIADLTDFGHPPAHSDEPLPAGAAPVTADDVLDMHQFLDRFQGDVSELFRSAERRT